MAKLTMVLLLFALTVSGAAAQGLPPPPPQALYGDATIHSQPAPVGTLVEARGANVKQTSTNPLTTVVAGQYGGPTLGERKLGVQGWLQNGEPIRFSLNGERAEVSRDGVTWQDSIPFVSGVVSRVHLRVTWRMYYPIWYIGDDAVLP